MTKKVFSKEKHDADMLLYGYNFSDATWPTECEGMTKEEIKELGFGVSSDWMIEVEVEDEPS